MKTLTMTDLPLIPDNIITGSRARSIYFEDFHPQQPRHQVVDDVAAQPISTAPSLHGHAAAGGDDLVALAPRATARSIGISSWRLAQTRITDMGLVCFLQSSGCQRWSG